MDDSRIADFRKTIASFNEKSTIDFGRFDYLVTPVGFSWEPGLCFIQAIKPAGVLFLVTKETKPQLDEMFEVIPLQGPLQRHFNKGDRGNRYH